MGEGGGGALERIGILRCADFVQLGALEENDELVTGLMSSSKAESVFTISLNSAIYGFDVGGIDESKTSDILSSPAVTIREPSPWTKSSTPPYSPSPLCPFHS